jgi:aldose 1-epimerase
LEQGFPGNAVVDVTFKVTGENALAIIYNAKADKTTTFNMTNHSYFNLNGHASGSVYTHTLQINAEHYTPVKDSKAIPTGEIAPVEGTPFDFTEAKPIGRDIEANDTQLHYGSGYDHNFAIDKTAPGVEKVATAYSPESGIQMEVYTDCVGIQLYTANFIVGQEGKGGVKYNNRDAFCLETQFYPNSINETNFSTPVTKAGDTYHTETDYKFSVR